jgi:hypothetical protein
MIKMFEVPVALLGAALPRAVVSPWVMTLSGAGLNHAPAQPLATPWRTTAFTRSALMARPDAVPAGLPTENRKQYVHKTRVNAGGDGASGPHPEWEPA